jgi:hypothetical protein
MRSSPTGGQSWSLSNIGSIKPIARRSWLRSNDLATSAGVTVLTRGRSSKIPLTIVSDNRPELAGIDYQCESEVAPTITYSLDWNDECGDQIAFPSYSEDKKLTTLAPCMKVGSIFLWRPTP